MAIRYTGRLCVWLPDLTDEIDYLAKSGYVRGIFVSLFDYVPPTALGHLLTSPLYQIEYIGWYNGFPAMLVFRVKS